MTKPDDRAQDAHPEAMPNDEALDGEQLPEDDELDGAGIAGESAEAGESDAEGPKEPAKGDRGKGQRAKGAASTIVRRGRESATSRGEGRASGRAARGSREPAVPQRAQTASDIAVHIDDRASAIFVIGVIAVFVLIVLNAVVLGKGGLLTPLPSPKPIPSLVPGTQAPPPTAPASAAPSGSVVPGASGSPAASASASTPSGSASPSATGSAAPSATPKPSAAPSPSPSPVPSPSG
jgi:hypothetical protein